MQVCRVHDLGAEKERQRTGTDGLSGFAAQSGISPPRRGRFRRKYSLASNALRTCRFAVCKYSTHSHHDLISIYRKRGELGLGMEMGMGILEGSQEESACSRNSAACRRASSSSAICVCSTRAVAAVGPQTRSTFLLRLSALQLSLQCRTHSACALSNCSQQPK